MSNSNDLRSSIVEAVAKVSGVEPQAANRCGPPALVFRVTGLRRYRFECRPISRPPQEHWVGLMYRPTPDGGARQAGVGIFKDGSWTNDKGKPLEGELYWTAIVDEPQDG